MKDLGLEPASQPNSQHGRPTESRSHRASKRRRLLALINHDALAGWLLTLMIAASVMPGVSLLLAGLLGWGAALLLSYRLGRRQRVQSAWLLGLGITIAACGVWLAPLHPEPNLMAMTLLMAWGIGVPANPLSGTHLIMQGRYGIDGYTFLHWNAGYVLKCLGVGVGLLYLYGMLLGMADWK